MIRIIVLLLAATLVVSAADEVVFNGAPEARVDSDGYYTKKNTFSPDARCTITRKGKNYFWTSRGDRKLTRIDAGDFVYYVSPEGSGMIKVRVNKPAGAAGWDYMETLTTDWVVVTYWGKSTSQAAKPASGQ